MTESFLVKRGITSIHLFLGFVLFHAAIICALQVATSAARFGGIPQIWCTQRANCGEIYSPVEFYFWWNFWGI